MLFFFVLKLPVFTDRILETDGIYLNVFSGLKTHPSTVVLEYPKKKMIKFMTHRLPDPLLECVITFRHFTI